MKQLCENCQAKYEFKIPLRICPWCGYKKFFTELEPNVYAKLEYEPIKVK